MPRNYIDDTRPAPRRQVEPLTDGLFAPQPPPPSTNNAQSLKAAVALLPRQGSMQRVVLTWLEAQGPSTCDAIEAATGLSHQTVAPRLLELERLGLVERLSTEHRTRSGRAARPYAVTAEGLQRLAATRERA